MNAEQEAAARRFDTVLQFAELHNRGLSFETNGTYLRLIPKGRATESDLRWATANKAELLELLTWLSRGSASPASESELDTHGNGPSDGWAVPLNKPALAAELDSGGLSPRQATIALLALARQSGWLGGGE